MKLIELLRLIFVVIIFPFSLSSVAAQKASFLISYSPVVPVSFTDNANIGLLSGNIGFGIELTKKVSWLSAVGYNKFGTKTATINGTNYEYESTLTFIPVTTGFIYYFKEAGKTRYEYRQKGTRLYGLIKAGYFFPADDLENGNFGINAGAGTRIASRSGKSKFDISLQYNGVLNARTKVFESGSMFQRSTFQNLSYLALHLGFEFSL